MTDLIAQIATAIAHQEGFFAAGTVAARCNNPGNLIFAGQDGAVAEHVIGKDNKVRVFAKFATPGIGIAALHRQLAKRIQEGYTLRRLICDPITGWAPASDGNDPAGYLQNVLRRVLLHADAPLQEVLGNGWKGM